MSVLDKMLILTIVAIKYFQHGFWSIPGVKKAFVSVTQHGVKAVICRHDDKAIIRIVINDIEGLTVGLSAPCTSNSFTHLCHNLLVGYNG